MGIPPEDPVMKTGQILTHRSRSGPDGQPILLASADDKSTIRRCVEKPDVSCGQPPAGVRRTC